MDSKKKIIRKALKGNGVLPCVSGSINFTQQGYDKLHVTSKSNSFENDVLIEVFDDCIIFKLAGLDDANSRKLTKYKYGYQATIQCTAPTGKFDFDVDESTEDELVVYYR